jgi:hypothetical protein
VNVVVDPVVILPPEPEGEVAWLEVVSGVDSLLAEGVVTGLCPNALRDAALATWFDGPAPDTGSGLPRLDLLRIASEMAGRLAGEFDQPLGEVLLDDVTLSPTYAPREFPEEHAAEFAEFIGYAACAKQDGVDLVMLVGPAASWTGEATSIEVRASILYRDSGDGDDQDKDGLGVVHACLTRTGTSTGILADLCEYPCRLIEHLEVGVRAFWVGTVNGDPEQVEFKIAADFENSLRQLGYQTNPRYAAACLRVMALIAGGRSQDVAGHPERDGAGGNNPTLTDAAGNTVHRSYLAQNSPNAHRLFWIRTQPPIFLNVTGHEGRPRI